MRRIVAALGLIFILALILACTGATGAPGEVGPRGPTGPAGEPGRAPTDVQLLSLINQVITDRLEELNGPPGERGEEGPQGIQGPAGDKGETGAVGPLGPQGIQGPIGDQGETGDVGPAGSEGDVGPAGLAGVRGFTGPQGLQGEPGPPGDTAPNATDYLPDIRDAIVFVQTLLGNGSGVRISQNEILTAQHVVGTATGVTVSIRGEGLLFATVTGYDQQRDVALLTIDTSSEGISIPLTTEPSIQTGSELRLTQPLGGEVSVVGYVSRISETTPVATFGRIGVLWRIVPGDITMGQIDAAATGGMSGGGVFNNFGELIGILIGGDPLFDGNNRYLSSTEIAEVLDDLRAGLKQ